MRPIISVADADVSLRTGLPLLPAEAVALQDAEGRVLREPIRADRDLPPFDRVMMDGFALHSKAAQMPSRTLRVLRVVRAGENPGSLESLEACVEVMTGCAMPDGADSVVPVEEVDRVPGGIVLKNAESVKPGRFVHAKASDAGAGDLLVPALAVLGPIEVALAAASGAGSVTVSRRPRILLLSTGDEVVETPGPVGPFQIRQANMHGIRVGLRAAKIPEAGLVHVPDDPMRLRAELPPLIEANDVVISCGGISMGKFDHLPALWPEWGFEPVFHGVDQRPGKPLAYCRGGSASDPRVWFALPGNPVSSLICFHRYVLPALRRMLGAPDCEPARVTLAANLPSGALPRFLPVSVRNVGGTLQATARTFRNSGELVALAGTTGFVELPKTAANASPGAVLDYFAWAVPGAF